MKVRAFLAAKTVDLYDCGKPVYRDLVPEAYVIHICTNDLTTDKTSEEIYSEILWLIKEPKTAKNKIVVSTLVLRGHAYNTNVEKVSTLLQEFCEDDGTETISHDNINVKKHLNKGKIHLNDKGISSFVKNFRDFLNVLETVWHESKHKLFDVSSSYSLSESLSLSKTDNDFLRMK